jgi:hypothetical protein
MELVVNSPDGILSIPRQMCGRLRQVLDLLYLVTVLYSTYILYCTALTYLFVQHLVTLLYST